ncbi:MAG: adenine deaminase [Ferruginibacter sp.]
MSTSISGWIVDILQKNIFAGTVTFSGDKIEKISTIDAGTLPANSTYILPGFIDSHVHVESSMLVPSEFGRMAVVHGTVGTISDPHEIANVCGIEGVEYMIANGKTIPFKFHFGAPSCVPATIFETAGASLNADAVDKLLQLDDIYYLSEMMNFPGVLFNDAEVMAKIASSKKYNKPVDGHAPGLRGADAKKYIDAGISTDHECFTAEEALDKLQYGMKILIREGSAAKNFEALYPLLNEHWENMMFCSDDKHPDSLVLGHINQLCARAVAGGIDVYKVLQAACINPVKHYNMKVGLLQEGDAADFILVNDLKDFITRATYINGKKVAENGVSLITTSTAGIINSFDCVPKSTEDFIVKDNGATEIPVIEALDGQLITNKLLLAPTIVSGKIVSDVEKDMLKITMINRYHAAPIATAFIKNFGIKIGAIASTVAHDSHNIIAVGADDESITAAVNAVIGVTGGISAVYTDPTSGTQIKKVLPLPVGGLMTNEDGYAVAAAYTEIDQTVKQIMGSTLASPFMTLSFMALLVIPHLKLSDKGLFNGDDFKFV